MDRWTGQSSAPNVSSSPVSNLHRPQSGVGAESAVIMPTESCPQRTEVAYQTTKASYKDTAFRFHLNLSEDLDNLINEELQVSAESRSSQTSTATSSRPVFEMMVELLEISKAGEEEKAVLIGVTQYVFTVGVLAKLLKNEQSQAKLVVVSSPERSSSLSMASASSSTEVAVVARIDAAFLLTFNGENDSDRRDSFVSPRAVFEPSASRGNVTILVHRATGLPVQLEDSMPPTAFVTATLPSTPGKGSSTKQIIAENDPVFNHMMYLELTSTEMKSGIVLSLVNNNNKGLIASCMVPVDGFSREQQVNLRLQLTSEDARSRNQAQDVDLYVSIMVHESAEGVYRMYEEEERNLVYTQLTMESLTIFEEDVIEDDLFCMTHVIDNADFFMLEDMTLESQLSLKDWTVVNPDKEDILEKARQFWDDSMRLTITGKQMSLIARQQYSNDGNAWKWQQRFQFHVFQDLVDNGSSGVFMEFYEVSSLKLRAAAYITFSEIFSESAHGSSSSSSSSNPSSAIKVMFPTVEMYLAPDLRHVSPLLFGKCQVELWEHEEMLKRMKGLANSSVPFPEHPRARNNGTSGGRAKSAAKATPSPPPQPKNGAFQRNQESVASVHTKHNYSVHSLSERDQRDLPAELQAKLELVTKENEEQIRELEKMVNERNEVIRQIGLDFIDQRKELKDVKKKYTRLRSIAQMRQKADQAIIMSSNVDEIPIDELPRRYAQLSQICNQQQQIQDALQAKVHAMENQGEDKKERQLEEMRKAHAAQAAYIQKMQAKMKKYDVKKLKMTVKNQEKVIVKLESVISKQLKGGNSMEEMETLMSQKQALEEELEQMKRDQEEQAKQKQEDGMDASERLDLVMRTARAETRVKTLEEDMISNTKKYSRQIAELKLKISELETQAMLAGVTGLGGGEISDDDTWSETSSMFSEQDWLTRPLSRGSNPSNRIGWDKYNGDKITSKTLGIPEFGQEDWAGVIDDIDQSQVGRGKDKVLPKIGE